MSVMTRRVRAVRVRTAALPTPISETLAVEAPLTVRVDGEPLAVTMRTPGHDVELALGWLVAEGAVRSPEDVVSARACTDDAVDGVPTTVDVHLAPGVIAPRPRNFLTTSACGVCGADSVAEVVARAGTTEQSATIEDGVLFDLPDLLRRSQPVFARTGGSHAAALFSLDGELVVAREDVGRHNAVDKVVGAALTLRGLPLSATVLQVSGRASFELTQKAAAAGIPVLAAVSAPSSLAVELAHATGTTLIGFSRGQQLTVYAGAERLRTTAARGGAA